MISKTVILTALLFAGIGLFTSRPQVLQWLNTQSPETAFFLWYILLFAFVEISSLVLFKRLDLSSLRIGVGVVMLVFAVGIVLYFPASTYSLIAVGANPSGTPSFLLASEDQFAYDVWHTFLPWVGNDILGILVYGLTPFLLVILAASVISPAKFSRAVKGLLRA